MTDVDDSLKTALALAYGYLIGSVPLAYLVGRWVRGIDIRTVGSGTVGASNVWHNVGKGWLFPIAAFDLFVQGMTPVYLARAMGLGVEVQAAAGLLAIVGHNWPLFLRFHGGRGVAPAVGVMMALTRPELALFILVAGAGWQLTRSAAPWVLVGFALLPGFALYWERPPALVLLMVSLLLVTVVKRLTSERLRGTGVPMPRLLANRLFYDRDIADHDAWVRRNAQAPP